MALGRWLFTKPAAPLLDTPHQDLMSARVGKATTGTVIPESKFVFWQTIFTSRFDARLWTLHLRAVLPHANTSKTVGQFRALVYAELEQLRKLRNRIAHHEPIFKRNLADDFQKVHDLIAFRCPITAAWMTQNQASTSADRHQAALKIESNQGTVSLSITARVSDRTPRHQTNASAAC